MDRSSAPLVFDVSSDDDEDIGGIDLDYDWLSELFPGDESEKERDGGNDADDVVVVSEVVGKNRKRKKVESDEEEDDDCVVLEGDPEKAVVVESGGARDEEDLVIVGEKGEIACRDYPHARHLCAKFQFASTPHEQHCHQCHCYVCDSLAPCIYWGNGSSDTDHCHSTDQDPIWKVQRKNFKQGNKAPLSLLQLPDTSLFPPPSQPTLVPASTQAQDPIASMSVIRACSTSTNFNISNLTIRPRSQQAVRSFPTNKFNPTLISQQLLSPSNNNNANNHLGRQTISILGAQYMNRPSIFRPQGSGRFALPNSPFGHGSTNNNHVPQYNRYPHPLGNLRNRSSTNQQGHSVTGSHSRLNYGGSSRGLIPPSQAQKSNSFVGSFPRQPQDFNSQFGSDNGIENVATSQQSSLRRNMGSTSVNSVPPPSQVIPQSKVNGYQNQVPSQFQVFSQPDTGGSFGFPPLESYSQANMGINNFENAASCQAQALSLPNTPSGNFMNPVHSQSQSCNQPSYSRQEETQSVMNPRSTDQYDQVDHFPTQDPGLSHPPPSEPEYDSSIIISRKTNNQYSYLCEPEPWVGGYVGIDGFTLSPPEATTFYTGPLFDF